MSTIKTFYGRHHKLVDPHNVAVSKPHVISDLMALVDTFDGLSRHKVRLSYTGFSFLFDLLHGHVYTCIWRVYNNKQEMHTIREHPKKPLFWDPCLYIKRSAVGRAPDSYVRDPRFDTRSDQIILFLLPLIQEGLLSVTGERMSTKYWLAA